jgi:hypothetical protein
MTRTGPTLGRRVRGPGAACRNVERMASKRTGRATSRDARPPRRTASGRGPARPHDDALSRCSPNAPTWSPVPADLAALATRATTSASAGRSWTGSTPPSGGHGARGLPTRRATTCSQVPGTDDATLRPVVDRLRLRAGVGADDEAHLVRPAREVLGPHRGLSPAMAESRRGGRRAGPVPGRAGAGRRARRRARGPRAPGVGTAHGACGGGRPPRRHRHRADPGRVAARAAPARAHGSRDGGAPAGGRARAARRRARARPRARASGWKHRTGCFLVDHTAGQQAFAGPPRGGLLEAW